MPDKAYLDIETSYEGDITIVGIFRPPENLVQIVHPEVNRRSLLDALYGADEIVTYWGHRFDLPVIRQRLRVNLRRRFASRDLADDCHRYGLYGGLKAVEQALGIGRETSGLSGVDAMNLWARWLAGDRAALRVLLKYNEEDVVNLYILEKEIFRFDAEAEGRNSVT